MVDWEHNWRDSEAVFAALSVHARTSDRAATFATS
jgi:hypothetical protein